MDSDSPGKSPKRYFRLWPGLWMPAAILIIGLALTIALASAEAQDVTHLGRETHLARHQALVAQVSARLQQAPGSHLPETLSSLLSASVPDGLHLRIDTLARHTKQALLELGHTSGKRAKEALRTELNLPGRHWMVTTTPAADRSAPNPAQAYWRVMTAGTGLTILAALLMLAGCRRHATTRALNDDQRRQLGRAGQTISNLQVEKSVLRHALNDSEARSRDLVALGGALIAELDDQGRIGFASAQAADLLARAPSDLINQPFEHLVSEQDRGRFRESMESARQGDTLVRADLTLASAREMPPLAVSLRMKAIKDPVHGITGFRLSATPLHPVI
ncbi:PAS domain-containing protein [Marinobacter sp. VGCF2001]|uniref:PAS domain-containing protein n=1 Tax=Marinobacter sp. VGCF2001 TaxID=3417189 RepID=UPI003CEBD1E1